MPVFHRILHPTDLSEASRAAFRLASALARDYGAELIVLHVYPTPFNAAEAVDRRRDTDLEDALTEKIRELVPEDKSIPVEYRVVEGRPADVILDAAKKCDLVVMGTHGRGVIGRALLGSVAEKVVRESTCPVATIRPSVVVPPEGATTAGAAAQAGNNADLGGGD